MPVTREWAYFDHAAVAPLTASAGAEISAYAASLVADGAGEWQRWSSASESARTMGAALIGADPDEVALVRSTTEGINLVAEGFPWREGDNVVTLADEFPSNQYPWMNLASRGVQTRRVDVPDGRVDLDELAAACDKRTRIVSISWVGYASGWRNDLAAASELAHSRGAFFFVDAIQGLGVFPIKVRDLAIDFLSADGHKWLLGPEGAGLFYLRREHLDLLRPLGLGWHSVAQGSDYSRIELTLRPTATRYEGGSRNLAGFVGLAASLKVLSSWPIQQICDRVIEVTDLACQRLAAAGAVIRSIRETAHKSGIVSFDWPGVDPLVARKRLRERKVLMSCRGGRLRISPHAYTTDEDIERLVEGLVAARGT